MIKDLEKLKKVRAKLSQKQAHPGSSAFWSIEYSIQSYIGNYLRDQIEYPKSSDKALLSVSL